MKQLIFTVTVLIWISGLLVSGCPKSTQTSNGSPTTKTTPIPNSSPNANVIYSKEGSSLEISCKDEATVNVTEIQLVNQATGQTLFNSRYPTVNESLRISVQNRSIRDFTFTFKSVVKQNAGFYQCLTFIYKANAGLPMKNYSIVVIDRKPTCGNSKIDTKNDTEVQLDCTISYQGRTSPLLQWRNQSDILCDSYSSNSNASFSSVSLKVPILEECEQGRMIYTCELVNNNSANEYISCEKEVPCKSTLSTVSGQTGNQSFGGSNNLTTILVCVIGAVLLTLGAVILCVKYGKCRKWKRGGVEMVKITDTDRVQMTDPAEAICYENVERKHNLPDVARTNDNSAIEQLYAQVDHQTKTKNQNNVDPSAAVYEDPVILKPKTNTSQKNKKGVTRPPPRTNVGPVDGTVYAVLDNNAKPSRTGSAAKPPAASGNQLPPAEPTVYAPVVHLKR